MFADASSEARVPKAAELVAAQIRRQIVSGELPAGTALPPEAELMESFGVSRPTLREALRVLDSELLITVRRGARGGISVRAPSTEVAARYAGTLLQFRAATLDDVHQARALVEPPAAAILAEQRNPAAIAELSTLLDEEASVQDDPVQRVQVGVRFHDRVVELSGNRTLAVLASMVKGIIDLHMAKFLAFQASTGPLAPERRFPGHDHHARLLALIEKGAAREAEKFWRSHLEAIRERLRQTPNANSVLDLLD